MNSLQNKIIETAKKSGIPTKKILDMFFLLKDGLPIDNNRLIQESGIAKASVNEIKKEFAHLFFPSSNKTQILKDKLYDLQVLYSKEYRTSNQKYQYLQNDTYQKVYEMLKRNLNARSKPKRQYDQFFATFETTVRRALLLLHNGDLVGKHIICIGDDDLISLAIAKIGGAESITVLDIDDDILNTIKTINKREGLRVETIKYDVREILPQKLHDRFDIVFTDPPYTPEGIKLFSGRAIDLLNQKNNSARLYICYGNADSAKERYLPIQNVLTESGLLIRSMYDLFSQYNGAESIGSNSNLYVCELTQKTKSLIKGSYHGNIYTVL